MSGITTSNVRSEHLSIGIVTAQNDPTPSCAPVQSILDELMEQAASDGSLGVSQLPRVGHPCTQGSTWPYAAACVAQTGEKGTRRERHDPLAGGPVVRTGECIAGPCGLPYTHQQSTGQDMQAGQSGAGQHEHHTHMGSLFTTSMWSCGLRCG